MKWPKDWTRQPDAIMRKVRLRKGRQLERVFFFYFLFAPKRGFQLPQMGKAGDKWIVFFSSQHVKESH